MFDSFAEEVLDPSNTNARQMLEDNKEFERNKFQTEVLSNLHLVHSKQMNTKQVTVKTDNTMTRGYNED